MVELEIEFAVVVVSVFVAVEVEAVAVVIEVVSVLTAVFIEFGVTILVTEVVCGIFAASLLLVVTVALLAKKDHYEISKNNNIETS